jgi:hypothetical protein
MKISRRLRTKEVRILASKSFEQAQPQEAPQIENHDDRMEMTLSDGRLRFSPSKPIVHSL